MDESSLSPAATLGYELVKERLSTESPQEGCEKGAGIRPVRTNPNCNLSELKQIRTKLMDIFRETLPGKLLSQKVFPNIAFTTDTAALACITEKNNNHRAHSVGFGNADLLKHFLLSNGEQNQEVDARGNIKLAPCQLKHTPTFFISLLENIDSILVPTPQHFLKREWKRYLNATPPPKPQPPFNPQQHAIKTERLQTQRDRVVKNITHILEKKPSTISLAHYASSDWQTGPITTNFDKKEVGRLEKLVSSFPPQQQDVVYADMHQPPIGSGGHPVYVNCFYCPPLVHKPKNNPPAQSENEIAFQDPLHADVNIHRLLVKTSLQQTLDHFVKFHSDRQSARVKSGHGLILPCHLCHKYLMEGKEEYNYFRYSCCLECLRSHYVLLHSEDHLLFQLHAAIRKIIVQESVFIDLKLVDFYFLSKCMICGVNLSSQSAVKIHEKLCLSKFVSFCSFFGSRLTQDLFYCKYTKKKEEEEDRLHAITQASLFLKRASAPTPTTPATPSGQTTVTTATREPFEQYLSRNYSQFLIKKTVSPSKQHNPNSKPKHKESKKDPGSNNPSTLVDVTHTASKKPQKSETHREKRVSSSQNWRKTSPAKVFIDAEALEDNRHLPSKTEKSKKGDDSVNVEDKRCKNDRDVIQGENDKQGKKRRRPKRKEKEEEEEEERGRGNCHAERRREEKKSYDRKEEEKNKKRGKRQKEDDDANNDKDEDEEDKPNKDKKNEDEEDNNEEDNNNNDNDNDDNNDHDGDGDGDDDGDGDGDDDDDDDDDFFHPESSLA